MSIIQVLRRPLAPNAFYHAACYAASKSEIVCTVLRLRDDQHCSECCVLIASGAQDEDSEETKLVQLSLF